MFQIDYLKKMFGLKSNPTDRGLTKAKLYQAIEALFTSIKPLNLLYTKQERIPNPYFSF